MKRIFAIALFLLTLLTLATHLTHQTDVAYADGIIIPEPPIICRPPCPIPPPPPRETPYLTVQNHRVEVTIDDQIATTRVDQIFRNDSQWSLEGTYIFPLPENAAINQFNMWIDGQKVEGQLYTKEEARQIYDNIVRRRLDPALLEYVGRDLFQASIFPIDPGDTRRVEIEYSQILPVDNGLVQYVYPLSTEKFSAQPLENVAVTVNLTSREPIKAIYSPSHPVSIQRDGQYRALIGWEEANVLPNTDFSLYYTISPEDVSANLLSTQQPGEDGFFTLLIAPNVEAEQVIDKDVILVLDVSGSMEGEKMEQARDALKYVLDHLNSGDRFNVIAFSTGVNAFSSRVEPASRVPEARRFVDNLRPEGSTDINRALLEAISSADRQRPTIVIFLTDGLPTSGVVETPLILSSIEQAATPNLRIFPFGVGDDVDTLLLDSLAQDNRGVGAYVRPGERVDEQVSSFYAKVSTPVLADIALQVNGVTINDTYPYPLPDLFAGTQLIVTGRYRQGGPATITLTGQVNGRPRTFRYDDLTFASRPGQGEAFIPRLWATRKIGYLLNQVRLNGENRETIDEIVNLSVRYGIITPYTSFLVEEPELALSNEGRQMIAQDEFAAAQEAPAPQVSGESAVSKAVEQNALAGADMAAPAPMPLATAGPDADRGGAATAAVTTVGDKAFVLRDGVWTDTTFDPTTMTATPLPFPSDEFLQFLLNRPDAGKYFALGQRVIVVLEGAAYETVEGDASAIPDRLDPASLPAATPVPPQPTDAPAQPQPASLPDNPAEATVSLTADVTEGAAPLEVNFVAQVVGGADNNPDFYCQPVTFDFGNGLSRSSTPKCAAWSSDAEIQRDYSANSVFDAPGEYRVIVKIGQAESAPVTVVVRGSEQSAAPAEESQPTVAVITTGPPAESPASGGLLSTCLPGLAVLPLAGLVLGRRVWPKK